MAGYLVNADPTETIPHHLVGKFSKLYSQDAFPVGRSFPPVQAAVQAGSKGKGTGPAPPADFGHGSGTLDDTYPMMHPFHRMFESQMGCDLNFQTKSLQLCSVQYDSAAWLQLRYMNTYDRTPLKRAYTRLLTRPPCLTMLAY